ncbi:MAG: hypothetical protein K2G59_05595 [Muribaculaceae bacterium]|nr:hypothetical protein [Muribaculaceae bacterium]
MTKEFGSGNFIGRITDLDVGHTSILSLVPQATPFAVGRFIEIGSYLLAKGVGRHFHLAVGVITYFGWIIEKDRFDFFVVFSAVAFLASQDEVAIGNVVWVIFYLTVCRYVHSPTPGVSVDYVVAVIALPNKRRKTSHVDRTRNDMVVCACNQALHAVCAETLLLIPQHIFHGCSIRVSHILVRVCVGVEESVGYAIEAT